MAIIFTSGEGDFVHNDEISKIVNHWVQTSDDDFESMLKMFESGSYNWTLFLGHIVIEKLLKAAYVNKIGKHAPAIHNLYRIVELGEIQIDDRYIDWLDTITSFNINARYDDYKREFYNLCTFDYTKHWINKIKELRRWIKKELLN